MGRSACLLDHDLSHAHSAFLDMYDGGKMDGADKIPIGCSKGPTACPPQNAQFHTSTPATSSPTSPWPRPTPLAITCFRPTKARVSRRISSSFPAPLHPRQPAPASSPKMRKQFQARATTRAAPLRRPSLSIPSTPPATNRHDVPLRRSSNAHRRTRQLRSRRFGHHNRRPVVGSRDRQRHRQEPILGEHCHPHYLGRLGRLVRSRGPAKSSNRRHQLGIRLCLRISRALDRNLAIRQGGLHLARES